MIQVSTGACCYHDGLDSCVHQVNVGDSHAKSNACWKCGGLGHFQKECKATLNSQAGDKDGTTLSDPSHTIGQISITWMTSMPITDLTFKAILKELVSSAIGNKRAFHPKLQTTPKTPVQLSTGGAGQVITPVVTNVAHTSSPSTISLPSPTSISPGSTPHSVNCTRGPPQTQ